MGLFSLIWLAVALSLDATVVSFSQGLILEKNKRKSSLLLALFFGFFQFLMPVIGFFCSMSIYHYLEMINNWIVFAIFMFLGIKFIKEAFDNNEENELCCLTLGCLIMFSIATSIDALASGISLCFAHANIWTASILIGIITFFNSLIGFWIGFSFKKFPAKYLEIVGGLILICLALVHIK